MWEDFLQYKLFIWSETPVFPKCRRNWTAQIIVAQWPTITDQTEEKKKEKKKEHLMDNHMNNMRKGRKMEKFLTDSGDEENQ